MHGRLAIHRGRGFWGSRGVALAGIVLLHAGLLVLGLQQRTERQAEPVWISVSLIAPRPAAPSPPVDAPRPRLEVPQDVVLLPQEFSVESSETSPATATAITAAAVSPAPLPRDPPVAAAPAAPLLVSQADYLRAPVLRYPPAALAARREGSVGLRVLVGEDGRVIDVIVEKPSGFAAFDEAACSALRAALFKPYTVNGEAQVVMIRIPVDFTLKRRGA